MAHAEMVMLYVTLVGSTPALDISGRMFKHPNASWLRAHALTSAFQIYSSSLKLSPPRTRPSHVVMRFINLRVRGTSPFVAHASSAAKSMRVVAVRLGCHCVPMSSRFPYFGTSSFDHFHEPRKTMFPRLPTPNFPSFGPRPFSHCSSNPSASVRRPCLAYPSMSALYAGAPAPHSDTPSSFIRSLYAVSSSLHFTHAPITAPIVIFLPFGVVGIADISSKSNTASSRLASPNSLIFFVSSFPYSGLNPYVTLPESRL